MSLNRSAYEQLCGDLRAEVDHLYRSLAGAAAGDWVRLTPAPGWTVRDQVAHLGASEELAALAITDKVAYESEIERLLSDLDGSIVGHLEWGRIISPGALVEWWRRAAVRTVALLVGHTSADRFPWAGRDMSASSFATARLMETWAHGWDIAAALGLPYPATSRLYHVADLGVRTRAFSYTNRGREVPSADVRVELRSPDGEKRTWGRADAVDRVTGSVLDFCLIVTQRRQVVTTALEVEGPCAEEWMTIAQAFAGPPPERSRTSLQHPSHTEGG